MHITILSTSALALQLITPCYATSYKYWIDASCSSKTGFDPALTVTESLQMALRASTRLASSSDTDFANVFKKIFSVDKADGTLFDPPLGSMFDSLGEGQKITAYNSVKDIMTSIGTDWSLVTSDAGRAASDVRIYCDNGAHFDTARSTGGWIDSVNKMRSADKCEKGNAFTTNQRLKIRDTDTQQNRNRVTITICDKQFNAISSTSLWHRLADVPSSLNLVQSSLGIRMFNVLTSIVILHEFTHTDPYALIDVGDGPGAYGWNNIVAMATADSLQNCDNHAYLGLWALLADRKPSGETLGGHTLPRPWQDATKGEGLVAAHDATAGKIRAYLDITDRVISAKKLIREFIA